MRAREPDLTASVDRDGVRIVYDVYGDRDETIVLLPAWAIADSRLWKAQVAYLSRHFRVVTYDPRGNGRSDRPIDPSAYGPTDQAGDALAILDQIGVERAVFVGNSFGTVLGYLLAAMAPERVSGFVAIGTTLNLDGRADDGLAGAFVTFDQELEDTEGWAKYNRRYWQADYPGFVDFFVRQAFNDPHSTKMIDDGLEWGLETTAEVLTATIASRVGVPPEKQAARLRSLAPAITCPVLVVHGEIDAIAPLQRGRDLAALLDAPLEVVPGAGHCPQARHPAHLNRLIRRFAEEATGTRPLRSSSPSRNGRPRVLFLSSPIGLGHARRDLAIADELRSAIPEAEVTWLAQDPVTRVLARRGERIHPASAYLASESSHLETEAGEHDLHVFEAFRDMDEIMVANFGVFSDVLEEERFDLVVGDEAWEVDHFLHEFPPAKQARFAWLTDFVGYLPMPTGGERERELTADYNLEMIRHVERNPEIRDRAIFVGDPEDVVDVPFGPGLPSIREWVDEHYRFSGYITGYDPAELGDRRELRSGLGYGPDETVCLVSVGGSGVGLDLLRRMIEAHPLLAESIPGLRTVIVTGPRIDPEALPRVPGVAVEAFLPDLHRHLAAADVSVVQGGLSTTMELTASGRPFVYVPLQNHFEQQIHVRRRLDRHRAGRCLEYARATPETIAAAVADELASAHDYLPVPPDGATRAAGMIAELL
jgi:pimeloyl-ACP methyl ester carboxylesterase/predicted glycosyltransferase